MKKFLFMAVAAFIFTTATQAQVHRKTDSTQQRMQNRKNHMQKMHQQLGLNADQEAKLKAMHQKIRNQQEAIKSDSSLSREQKREKFKELNTSRKAEMSKILTPEQMKKMETIQKENREKHRKQMKDRKGKMPKRQKQS